MPLHNYGLFKVFNNFSAAFCWACLLELPDPINFLELVICADILNVGLCIGPEEEIKIYLGSSLKFLREYSWSWVFASMIAISDLSKFCDHKSKTNLLAYSKPLSIKIAPINASHESLKILSLISVFFYRGLPILYIYLNLFFQLSKHRFFC